MKLTFGPTARLLAFGGSLFFILTGFSGPPSVVPPIDKVADARPQYLYCGFTGDGENEFAMAVSSDGEGWNGLPDARWKTPAGYVNAPTCLQYRKQLIAHAASANEKDVHRHNWYIGIRNSGVIKTVADVDWSNQIPGLDTCFSGEWFQDESGLHLTIPCTTDHSHITGWKTYETHPLTADLSQWSDPVDMHVQGIQMYDSTVFKVGGKYLMWVTEFNGAEIGHFHQRVEMEQSSSFLGPYTRVTVGDWAHWQAALDEHEGANLYRLPNGNWRVHVEKISTGRMYFSDCDSEDFSTCNWTALKPWREDRLYRHGTVRTISRTSNGDSLRSGSLRISLMTADTR